MLHRLAVATHGPNNCCLTGAQQGYKGGRNQLTPYQPLSTPVRNIALSFFTAARTAQTGSRRIIISQLYHSRDPLETHAFPKWCSTELPRRPVHIAATVLTLFSTVFADHFTGINRDGHCFTTLPASIKSIG